MFSNSLGVQFKPRMNKPSLIIRIKTPELKTSYQSCVFEGSFCSHPAILGVLQPELPYFCTKKLHHENEGIAPSSLQESVSLLHTDSVHHFQRPSHSPTRICGRARCLELPRAEPQRTSPPRRSPMGKWANPCELRGSPVCSAGGWPFYAVLAVWLVATGPDHVR